MFGPRKAAATYAAVDLEARVTSANRHELIQMLYDGAIVSVNHAHSAITSKDIAAKNKATSKAISIIEEGLRGSLDKDKGGPIAGNLDGLYEYMSQRLLLASLRSEPNGILEVKKLLTELRDAWSAIGHHPARSSLTAFASVALESSAIRQS
jgi:flagellar secretion chaperone FliS